jgi:hypothetical protein
MNAPLDRAAMHRTLDELNEALRRVGVRADLYVFGGAYAASSPTDLSVVQTEGGEMARRPRLRRAVQDTCVQSAYYQ